jgi:hypothetical protein
MGGRLRPESAAGIVRNMHMIKSGEILAEKCGNSWQVPRSEVERLLSGIDRTKVV